jgi:hypothetical protein
MFQNWDFWYLKNGYDLANLDGFSEIAPKLQRHKRRPLTSFGTRVDFN